MQGVEERRLKRTSGKLQGEAIEDNASDDILIVDQGKVDVIKHKSPIITGYFHLRT